MAQQDKLFTAFFLDTTTAPWVPLEGLSATITITEIDGGAVVVNGEAMQEVGGGWYKFIFEEMNAKKDYLYACSPNSLLAFIETWVTDKRLNNIDLEISAIWRGAWAFNYQGIYSQFTTLKKELENKIDDINLEEIKEKIDEATSTLFIDNEKKAYEVVDDINKATMKMEEERKKEKEKMERKEKKEKENKEKLEREKKEEEEKKEREEILSTLEEMDNKLDEIKKIREDIDKEETNNILSLLK